MSGFEKCEDSLLFHAGTARKENEVITNGGRVLAITSIANNIEAAKKISMQNAEKIMYQGKYYRRDIGNDLM